MDAAGRGHFCGRFPLGGLLASLAWFSYYTWWEYNARYATVFAIAIAVSVALFFSYVRFVKFMERP